jgi:predicted acyl esterase
MMGPGRAWIFLLWVLPSPCRAKDPPSPATYGVRLQSAWIPMKDGVRLAATLFMPDGAKATDKFPAVLEYLPYRKDDGTAANDYPVHTYFAHRGYVTARVDIRGTGASEGRPHGREYSEQEQLDGIEVIEWLAHEPWSNGNVGMFGISWGGFNSIQLAMRRPPGLKAIIAVDATEELFHDDIHYIDGLMHIDEFELNMDMAPGMTGAPDYTLDERILGPRFDTAPWSLLYLKHQRDSEFWRSPVRPLDRIEIPCFLIGGLVDGYRDSIPRMLTQVRAPVKAILGPWNHSEPHDADFGPRIEWRDEAVRWWDQWLKGRDTGVVQDPKLTVYMRRWFPPNPNLESVPGEWRVEEGWPPRGVEDTILYFWPNHTLSSAPPRPDTHKLKCVPSAGVEAGFWWGELLSDQRPVDAFSLVYDSEPLTGETAILGRPHALLKASADAPLADWFVRLSDVAPDGSVTQITGAGLGGAQRASTAEPRDLEPNQVYPLDVEMHLTSWVFPVGHRIRIAVSNALWPMIWPTPYPMTTSLELGGNEGSRLLLPVVPLHGPSPGELPRPKPSEYRSDVRSTHYAWPGEWTLERDEARQKSTVVWRGESNEEFPWGKETDSEQLTYEVDDAHPEANSVKGEAKTVLNLKGRVLTWLGHLSVSGDQKSFFYKYTRELLKDGKTYKQKTWEEVVARDHQ